MATTPSFHRDKLAQLIAVMMTSLLVGDFNSYQCCTLVPPLLRNRIFVGAFAVLTGLVIWTLVYVIFDFFLDSIHGKVLRSRTHRSMSVMHKTLFGASIAMFMISVITLGLIIQELSSDVASVGNRQGQIILAVLQVISTCCPGLVWPYSETRSMSLATSLLYGGNLCCLCILAVEVYWYRVWVIWGHSYLLIVGPMIMLIVGAGSAIRYIVIHISIHSIATRVCVQYSGVTSRILYDCPCRYDCRQHFNMYTFNCWPDMVASSIFVSFGQHY